MHVSVSPVVLLTTRLRVNVWTLQLIGPHLTRPAHYPHSPAGGEGAHVAATHMHGMGGMVYRPRGEPIRMLRAIRPSEGDRRKNDLNSQTSLQSNK